MVSLMIAAITDAIMIFFIDYTLNILCIMLMTPYYKEWYRNLCCCCIQTCVWICLCDKEQQKQYSQYHLKGIDDGKDDTNTSTNGESEENEDEKNGTNVQQIKAESNNGIENNDILNVKVMRREKRVKTNSMMDDDIDGQDVECTNIEHIPSDSGLDKIDELRKENERLKNMVKKMEYRISEKRKVIQQRKEKKDVEIVSDAEEREYSESTRL